MRWTRFARALLFLLLVVGSVAAQGPPPRKPHDFRCGRAIPWRGSFDEALKEAQATGKPVFWFVPATWRTSMDRKQELYWYMMAGMFSDPVMVSWIRENFVPLRFSLSRLLRQGYEDVGVADRKTAQRLGERYGLKRLGFVEPGFLILDPKGEARLVMDKLNTYNAGWMRRRMEAFVAGEGKGLVAAVPAAPGEGPLGAARAALAADRIDEALKLFRTQGKRTAEARYFEGVCLHMLGRSSEGDAVWKKAAKGKDTWAAKAEIELARWGPFMHGFEDYRTWPERSLARVEKARDLRVPTSESAIPRLADSSLRILLSMQREDGSWNDSRYDFGGLDSMPNVHVAVTAIVARALVNWRDRAPKAVDAAIERALPYLLDEKNTNPKDSDELIWAHTYRILFLARLAETSPRHAQRAKKKMGQLVKLLEKSQAKNGSFHHEYANPFATASAVYALNRAKEAGVTVHRKVFERAAKALAVTRGKNAAFAYGQRKPRGDGPNINGAAGRSPLCELALVFAEASDGEKLAAIIDRSMKYYGNLEAVRHYDDHTDRYANGGFFFWFDMEGWAQAIERGPAARRAAWKAAMRKIVLDIHQADGGWLDSHELGKSYGTAMALNVLQRMMDLSQ